MRTSKSILLMAAILCLSLLWPLSSGYCSETTGQPQTQTIEQSSALSRLQINNEKQKQKLQLLEKELIQQSAAVIADSNGGGTAVADRIAESQQSAQTGISDAEKSAERITDLSDRIAEASKRVNNNIESAEAANQSASSALERAFQLCRECRELNTSSQSIITTGQTRDAGGTERARDN